MTAPVFSRREAQPLDRLIASAGGEGWAGLDKLLEPALAKRQSCEPGDDIKKALAVMARAGQGRAVIEWLMDITVRAPFRVTGATVEETAMRASNRQGIEGVAEAVLAAIADGERLLSEERRGD